MNINRRNLMKGTAGLGAANTIPLAAALEGSDQITNPEVDFTLEDVWPVLVEKAREEIGGLVPLTADTGTQSVYQQRQKFDQAIGDQIGSAPGIPLDFCVDIPQSRRLCLNDPLRMVKRGLAEAPKSCNTYRKMIRFGFNAADFEWSGNYFWGEWEIKANVQCWMGIDETGCLWAGTRPDGSFYAGPENPVDPTWAFQVCGGPICPDEMVAASTLSPNLAADIAFNLAKGFLPEAIDWWQDLTAWQKAAFIIAVAICIVAIILVSYVGFPALGGALGLGGLLASSSLA